MTMQCPSCKSENVQNNEMAFMSGTSNLAGQISGGSVSVGTFGVGVGGHSGKITGTQQTALAKKLGPPTDPNQALIWGVIGLSLVGTLIAVSYITMDFGWALVVFGGLFIAFISLIEFSGHGNTIRGQFKKDYAAWKNGYVCLRCGRGFAFDLPPSPSDVQSRLELDNELRALVNDGKLIKAVVKYQGSAGVGLKEAQDYVNSL